MASLTVEIELSDLDEKIIKSHLIDIDKWALAICTEKEENCWKRFKKYWTVKLTNDADFKDTIPSNKEDLVALVTARSDYKDRATQAKEISV
jgi:hypothetical protein|tara:strand:+ start:460 stop:735 length:276 start_codon:yes stop_codon:yes gene_type:complete